MRGCGSISASPLCLPWVIYSSWSCGKSTAINPPVPAVAGVAFGDKRRGLGPSQSSAAPGWVLDSFGASHKNGIWAAASFPIPFPSSTLSWAVCDTKSENAGKRPQILCFNCSPQITGHCVSPACAGNVCRSREWAAHGPTRSLVLPLLPTNPVGDKQQNPGNSRHIFSLWCLQHCSPQFRS